MKSICARSRPFEMLPAMSVVVPDLTSVCSVSFQVNCTATASTRSIPLEV